MKNMVLVTGSYGFLGRYVAKHFSEMGWEVVGIGHGTWSREEWSSWGLSEWHLSDISMESLLTYAGRPSAIVHCAGSGSVGFSIANPYQDFLRTVKTAATVLEFVRLYAQDACVIYPSSAAVYGAATSIPINESDYICPVSPYGFHKRISEELCISYGKQFGVKSAVVRFFSLYGEGLRKQLLWDACSKLSRGDDTFYGTGREMRDLLHVRDAASLIMAAYEHASENCPIVNGGTGEGVSVRELLLEIFQAAGKEGGPHFSGAGREGDPTRLVADTQRSLMWSWEPAIPWRAGVRKYVDWYKAGAL